MHRQSGLRFFFIGRGGGGVVNSVLNFPNGLVDLLGGGGGIWTASSLSFSSDLVMGVHAHFALQAKKNERLLVIWGDSNYGKTSINPALQKIFPASGNGFWASTCQLYACKCEFDLDLEV